MASEYTFRSGQVVKIENGCGCVFCDLDLEPSTRIKNMFRTDCSTEYFHVTRHGDIPCTKQR